jgi:hypothetical protein
MLAALLSLLLVAFVPASPVHHGSSAHAHVAPATGCPPPDNVEPFCI